ncbi:hypothetical protein ACFFNY_20935 [Paenibacillus hodogayensis]|uniref:Aminoglycoside phosphotransferase domain-containing protein n=1 Tax=Paenibacillus hodogayensis TaxID=279208 RepID=A0ABV5W1C4_9BACL
MLETLKDVIPVPKVLEFWDGDEIITGALLLSAIQGIPCTEDIDEKLSFQIGVYHAMLHEVKTPGYGYHVTDGFKNFDPNNWRLHIKGNFEKWKKPCKEALDPELVNDNKVTGIIDFESARGGSSEIDFTKINRYIWGVNPRTKLLIKTIESQDMNLYHNGSFLLIS